MERISTDGHEQTEESHEQVSSLLSPFKASDFHPNDQVLHMVNPNLPYKRFNVLAHDFTIPKGELDLIKVVMLLPGPVSLESHGKPLLKAVDLLALIFFNQLKNVSC